MEHIDFILRSKYNNFYKNNGFVVHSIVFLYKKEYMR